MTDFRFNIGKKSQRLLLLASASAIALLTAGRVSAQTAPDNQTAGIETVTVTAEKRSENVQNIPATINVVGSQQLDQFHVTQLTDVAAYVPGLQVDSGGTPGQTTISMRGIAPISGGATVGTYIDDTPIGATSIYDRGGNHALDILPYDVSRIEVLEGPQGTLYGANSLGGVLRYVLTTPSLDDTEIRVGGDILGIAGSGSVGGGGRAMINTALIPDRLGLIASVATEDTPGYIDNTQTGKKDQNASRQLSGRLALLWQPTSTLSVKLGAIYQHVDADGYATVALDPTTLKPLNGDLTDNNYVPNTYKSALQYYTADVNWDLDWATLVSATSYSYQTTKSVQDFTRLYQPIYGLFGFPDGLAPFPLGLTTKKFTQEVRLSSPSNVNFEWLVGGFYDHEKGTNTQVLEALNPDGTPIAGVNPALTASLPTTYEEYAVFGDFTYHFTSNFDISGGVRYAHNKQTFTQEINSVLIPSSAETGASSQGVWTYSASPRFHVNDNVMLYARVASGYQAGGPNFAFPGVPPSVNASTLTNYEAGVKSEFWDHRAILNVSAFDLEWNKIQISATLPSGIGYFANGGTARSRGFEADGTLSPIDGLIVQGNITYTDAIFTQDVPSVGAFEGNRMPFIPKWSGSLQAAYTWPLTADWSAGTGAGLRLVGTRYSSGPFLIDEFKTGAYGALDAHVEISNARYTIRLFAQNLTNTRAYLTDVAAQNALTGANVQVEGTVLQPRTIGLALDAKF